MFRKIPEIPIDTLLGMRVRSDNTGNVGYIVKVCSKLEQRFTPEGGAYVEEIDGHPAKCLKHDDYHTKMIIIEWKDLADGRKHPGGQSIQAYCDLDWIREYP